MLIRWTHIGKAELMRTGIPDADRDTDGYSSCARAMQHRLSLLTFGLAAD